MPLTLIHPGNEAVPKAVTPPSRLHSLSGRRIGLLDISKPGGGFFLDRLETILREHYGVAEVVRVRKPTFAKNAPPAVIEKLRAMDAVVEGLAD